jgi:hypothetical protein
MATITTTTVASGNAFPYPPTSAMDRNPVDNSLWIVFASAANTLAIYKSTDNGLSWGSQGTFTATGIYTLGEMRIDSGGQHVHVTWLDNNGSKDRLIYKRIPIGSGTADLSTGSAIVATGGSGTPQAFFFGACVYPNLNPDGTYAVVFGASFHGAGGSGWNLYALSIKNDGLFTTYPNDGIIYSTRHYVNSGDDTAITISCDVEHNGDGITSNTPNLWFCAQIFDRMYLVKLAWQGYKSGWTSPASATLIASGRSTVRDLPGRWDGKRYIIPSPNPSNLAQLDVYERNQSNTSTTKRTTPSHPQGATIASNVLAWNHVTGDLRVFAVGGAAATVYYVDYIRATNTWGSWTLVSATAPVTSEWSVRRGTAGDYQYDFYMASGAGTPWTVSNVVLAVNFAPNQPTWVYGTGTTPALSGAAFDVSSSLTLDWSFNDPNLTDTQGTYALQRQIGTGTIQWWRTSDSTWQTVETQNASATSAVTLTTAQWLGAGGAADPAHVYKVRTWDAGGLPSAAYSAGLSVIPSTRVDPTLTAPTAAQILNSGIVTATWTVTEQAAYRVTVTNVATGAVVHDSGFLTDPTPLAPSILSYDVPTVLQDGFSGSLTLQTKNAEGLTSVTRTVAFSVDFVEPVAPIITALTAVPASGGINVTVTQAAATGTQPATVQMDLWRRKVVTVTPTNSNPTFEVNANDWTNSNYSTAARSTVQAHTGVGSLLLTPTGAAATPFVQTTTIYPITGGSRWEARGWFRPTTANKVTRMYLQWYDNVNALISSSTRDLTPVAGVWIWGYFAAAAPSNAVGVRLAIGQLATPAAGDTMYVDDMQLFPANDDLGIRINANIASGTTYLDWRAVAGTEYEWRGYAVAANSTAVYGPWQS